MKSFYRVLCCALLMGSASAAPGAREGVWKGGGCTLQKEYKQERRGNLCEIGTCCPTSNNVCRENCAQQHLPIYINFEHWGGPFWTHNPLPPKFYPAERE